MKLRLVDETFKNHTGMFGIVMFENGLSVDNVDPIDALRIGNSILAEWENGKPVNSGQMYNDNVSNDIHHVAIENSHLNSVYGNTEERYQHLTADQAIERAEAIARRQFDIEGIQANQKAIQVKSEPKQEVNEKLNTAELNVLQENQKQYSREELEAIAEKDGIKKLREIANERNIKGNSINDIINKLLQG